MKLYYVVKLEHVMENMTTFTEVYHFANEIDAMAVVTDRPAFTRAEVHVESEPEVFLPEALTNAARACSRSL